MRHPQANYKILAARIQNDIYLLTMRLRHTTLRAEFEQTVSERARPSRLTNDGFSGTDFRITFWITSDKAVRERSGKMSSFFAFEETTSFSIPSNELVHFFDHREKSRFGRWSKKVPFSNRFIELFWSTKRTFPFPGCGSNRMWDFRCISGLCICTMLKGR